MKRLERGKTEVKERTECADRIHRALSAEGEEKRFGDSKGGLGGHKA